MSIVLAGVFITMAIFFIGVWPNFVSYIGGISLIGLGVFFFAFGIYVSVHYAGQYKNLMKDLEKMTLLKPNCPSWGKELPQGNFEFCPFCGNSLKK